MINYIITNFKNNDILYIHINCTILFVIFKFCTYQELDTKQYFKLNIKIN